MRKLDRGGVVGPVRRTLIIRAGDEGSILSPTTLCIITCIDSEEKQLLFLPCFRNDKDS